MTGGQPHIVRPGHALGCPGCAGRPADGADVICTRRVVAAMALQDIPLAVAQTRRAPDDQIVAHGQDLLRR